MLFPFKKFYYLILPAPDENVDNLLLVLADHLSHHESAI